MTRSGAVPVVGPVVAALIVFEHVADPGDVRLGQLVAVSAVGPFLLPRVLSGPVRLLRWWRRRHADRLR